MVSKDIRVNSDIHRDSHELNLRYLDFLDKALENESIIKYKEKSDGRSGYYYVYDKEKDNIIYLYPNSDVKKAIYETKANYIIKGINTILDDVTNYYKDRKMLAGIMGIFDTYEAKFPGETRRILISHVNKDIKAVESKALLVKMDENQLNKYPKSNIRIDINPSYLKVLYKAIDDNSKDDFRRKY